MQPLLPSVFNDEDAEQIIRDVLKNSSNPLFKDSLVIGHSAVTSNSFVNSLKPVFDPLIQEKAKEVVASGAYLQSQADQRSAKMKSGASKTQGDGGEKIKDRKEERRKKASEGKAGGGVQGRETKTKATKKKYLKGRNDSDDEGEDEVGGTSSERSASSFELVFMSPEEIGRIVRKQESVADAPDEFIEEIAARLHKYFSIHLLFSSLSLVIN